MSTIDKKKVTVQKTIASAKVNPAAVQTPVKPAPLPVKYKK
jgi:hypothetical protein